MPWNSRFTDSWRWGATKGPKKSYKTLTKHCLEAVEQNFFHSSRRNLLSLLVNEASKCHWAVLLHGSSSQDGEDTVVLMLGCGTDISCWGPYLSSGQDIPWDRKCGAYKLLQALASYFVPSSILGKKEDFSRLCPAFLQPHWNTFGIVPNSRCVFHILMYICM